MIKEWLIRTKNNHVLGPVTKEKIKQLITNGSIKGDDEVCAGNGYWFFVREQNLVDKYVFGDMAQGFNPVQESLPVLTQISSLDRRSYPVQEATDGAILPNESDLVYPGEDSSVKSQTNDTSVGFNPKKDPSKSLPLSPPRVPGKKKTNNKVSADKLSNIQERAQVKTSVEKKTPPREIKTDAPANRVKVVSKTSMSGTRLILITLLFVIVGAALLYFRGSVVKKLIESSSLIVPKVYAQTLKSNKKKNGLISLR